MFLILFVVVGVDNSIYLHGVSGGAGCYCGVDFAVGSVLLDATWKSGSSNVTGVCKS